MLDVYEALGRDMFLTGLVSSHSGSMSTRADDRVQVTRRGAMLGHLTAEDLREFALDEEPPEDGADELPVHLAIYKATDARAVIFARPPWTMALALIEDRLSPANADAAEGLGSAPVLITQRPLTSPDVSQMLARILRDNRVVALRGHGVFARGEDLADALRVLSLLEEMCKVVHIYRSLVGEEPQPFVRERQPANVGHAKNGGGAVRRPPARPAQPRQPNTGGNNNWRRDRDRDEGPPRRGPNESRPPSGPRRGPTHQNRDR